MDKQPKTTSSPRKPLKRILLFVTVFILLLIAAIFVKFFIIGYGGNANGWTILTIESRSELVLAISQGQRFKVGDTEILLEEVHKHFPDNKELTANVANWKIFGSTRKHLVLKNGAIRPEFFVNRQSVIEHLRQKYKWQEGEVTFDGSFLEEATPSSK